MIRINDEVVKINKFPDGTLNLKLPEMTDFNFAVIQWNYENEEELSALIYLTGALKDNHVSTVRLDMPYIPNARMDRTKNCTDVLSLKYFAKIINSLGFEGVKVFDPHSSVSEALIDSICIESPQKHICTAMIKVGPDLIFYPDEGAMKRYSGLIGAPYAFGIKHRDWVTGKILGLNVVSHGNDIKGKKILIVDDICSRGGTFLHSARKLKELGAASVSLYVSHCENTILEGELLNGDLVDKVYTTNSIFTGEHPKIEVIAL